MSSDKIKSSGYLKLVDFDTENLPVGTIVFTEDKIAVFKTKDVFKTLNDKKIVTSPLKRLIFEDINNVQYFIEVDIIFLDQLKKYQIPITSDKFKIDVVLLPFYDELYSCYIDIKLKPEVGNFCLHYNYLSEILEVHEIKKDVYSLKLKTFYDEGDMVHSTTMYTLIRCNRKNLAKSIWIEA